MAKNFRNSHAFHRMNFLSQCQQTLIEEAPMLSNLQAFYGHTLHIVSRRTQSKMSPSLKRTMCKKCSTLLVPGINSKVRTRGSRGNKRVITTCQICGTIKRVPCSDSKKRRTHPEPTAASTSNKISSGSNETARQSNETKRKNSETSGESVEAKKPKLDASDCAEKSATVKQPLKEPRN